MTIRTKPNPRLIPALVSLLVGEDRRFVCPTDLHLLHEDADGEQEWAGIIVHDDAKIGRLNVQIKTEPQPKPRRGRPPNADGQVAAALAKAFLHVVANETQLNEKAVEATLYADARSVRTASREYLDPADCLHIECDSGEDSGAYLLDEPLISKLADGSWCLSGHAKYWRPGMRRTIRNRRFELRWAGDRPPICGKERPLVVVVGKK